MSDGLKVNIEISAPTGEAQEAFAKVAEGVKQLTDQIARQTGKVKDSFDITKILSRIRPWAQALGDVRNKLDETVGAALSWNKEVNALSRTLGISTKEAGGLAKALGNLGTSSDAYTGAVSDLQRSLDAQEGAFNANGVATRDAGGEMLGIQQVMMNTLKRTKEMKPGYDANALAMRQRRRRTYAPLGRRDRCVASETPDNAFVRAGVHGRVEGKRGGGDPARLAFVALRPRARGVFCGTEQCRCSNHRQTQHP